MCFINIIIYDIYIYRNYPIFRFGFASDSAIKNLPAMQETWVRSQGCEVSRRRKWQTTPVFLPGKSHGQRSLVGYSPWGHKRV